MSGDPFATMQGRPTYSKGEKVIVSGVVRCAQDFAGWEMDFGDGMEFTVKGQPDRSYYFLEAPGYGDLSSHGNYGNGCIYIHEKYIQRAPGKPSQGGA